MKRIGEAVKMEFWEFISKAWPVFIGFVGLCGWIFRLESDVKNLTRKTDDLIDENKNLHIRQIHIESELVEKLTRMREQLARIEGALGVGK